MQVGPPVDAAQQMPEKRRDVMDVQVRIVFAGDDEQILRQRKLPLPREWRWPR